MLYEDPYAVLPYYLYLGRYSTGFGRDTRWFDLSALRKEGTVEFFARYGNTGTDYTRGLAKKREDGTWDLSVSGENAVAAARYFANQHKGE